MSISSVIEHAAAGLDNARCSSTFFATDLGWMGLAWRGTLVGGLVFGHRSQDAARSALRRVLRLPGPRRHVASTTSAEAAPAMDELADELCRFAAGERVDFGHVAVDDAHLTPFARRVAAACRRIAWGETRTYGQLAAACGSPGAARAVGQVMATNRCPLIVPCHRVLAAGGRLGGYSAPQSLHMKRRLLTMEQADVPPRPR